MVIALVHGAGKYPQITGKYQPGRQYVAVPRPATFAQHPVDYSPFVRELTMRQRLLIATLSLFSLPLMAHEHTQATGCAGKQQAIEQQLEHAREQGNAGQQAGLEKALAEVKANCTDDKLRDERLEKIKAQREEIAERERDLREAEIDADSDKIAKRRAKLEEARQELQNAEAELSK